MLCIPSGMALNVTVVYSPAAREVVEVALAVEPGTTVAAALHLSGLLQRHPGIPVHAIAIGVWGRKADASQLLRDLDRVEIYRPLKVDPKVARRERFVKQGSRAAGLFARRRPGSKAGY